MKIDALFVILLACAVAGCQIDDKPAASSVKPTPPDVKEMVAAFSICNTATFVERKPLEGNRELLLFLDNGFLTVDNLKTFEKELATSGWKSKGKHPQASKKYPSQQEHVYERDGTEMSYWYGGSYGFQMIGITLPKQEDAGANKNLERTRNTAPLK
jgi:hypothetical protein